MQTVAVVGARGMLGGEVVRQLSQRDASPTVVALDLPELDITSPASLAACEALGNADVILNCAGYTDVERAEDEEEKAWQVNGEGVRHLAERARDSGALLVHVSTDFVFDGSRSTPYPIDAEPQPLSAYGRSKRAGEEALRDVGGRTCLVRSAWLFGPGGRNFVDTILERAVTAARLAVVADQQGSPTYTRDLADALIRLAAQGVTGTVHCTNAGSCTWHAFACAIVAGAGLDLPVDAISSAEARIRFGLKAERPGYSVLDDASLVPTLGRGLRPWSEALRAYLAARGSM